MVLPKRKHQNIEAIDEFFKKEPRVISWGVCLPEPAPNRKKLSAWVNSGKHGDMHYLSRTLENRMNPVSYAPWAKSLLFFSYTYELRGKYHHFPAYPVASYAQGRDYHRTCREVLKRLEALLASIVGRESVFSGFTDTAPVFERDLAARAGLGWRGKNCMLIDKTHGTCFFLAGCFTSLELPLSTPVSSHCGDCRACLDACPTGALEAPGVLDARKCLSYLTIEYRGRFSSLTSPVGKTLYGCDICQAVCPWNKHQNHTRKQVPVRFDKCGLDWACLLRKGGGFNRQFKDTPLGRTGRKALLRNLAFRAAHLKDSSVLRELKPALAEETDTQLIEDLKTAIQSLESR